MEDIIKTLQKVNDLKALLTVNPGTSKGFPAVKTLYNKPEFLAWKEKTLLLLRSLKPEPIIMDTIALLNDGFKSGWKDETNFRELQAKIGTIIDNIELFLPDKEGDVSVTTEKLKKNTVVKTAFDEYTLIKQVGSGGNGRVFSASNGAGEQFAIKFLERNIGGDKLKRFKNEIAFCEQHQHKNIVSILDRGYAYLDEKDYVFYVMPLFEETLKSKIKEGIIPDDAVSIFVGILEGLKYAHDHNAIHRDIKPENVLFAAGSTEPVICDFGIAHFAEEDLLTAIETKPGDRMANFYYAAPEQYKRGVVTTPQTDVYSAALILNEMFTGEIPQAAGYTKIADVNADYGYLDDVFEQLYIQDPAERLYPEERIITEMKLLAERNKREREKAILQSVVNELVDPGEFEAKIVKKEYRDGKLVFTFDIVLPDGWYQFIAFGSYSCSFVMGYEHEKLKKIAKNELAMPLRKTESESNLKTIIGNIEDWVRTANRTYSQTQKRNVLAEQQRKEAVRKEEIERIEKEDAFASMISNLL